MWCIEKLLVFVRSLGPTQAYEVQALVASGPEGFFDFQGVHFSRKEPVPLDGYLFQILEDRKYIVCCTFDQDGVGPGNFFTPTSSAGFRPATQKDIDGLGMIGNYTRKVVDALWLLEKRKNEAKNA